MIAARTIIGHGAPTKAGIAAAHGAPLGAEEVGGARLALGWPYPPFEIPDAIRTAWAAVGVRGSALTVEWEARRGTAQDAAGAGPLVSCRNRQAMGRDHE